ncbi:hypothetical protein [Bradyrhizobium manausense]|uniref:hypothetical protein n=1 Tax=Bradyrhizobium manausense TaxID=989370 RepID=UPI00390823A8
MASQTMATPNIDIARKGQTLTEPSSAKLDDIRCPPMSHQNSGSHGHEMYPQQFVRLVGCHGAPSPGVRKRQDEKLH